MLINDFIEFCYETFSMDPQNIKRINSNTFKKSQEYSLLIDEDYKNTKFYAHLTEFFDIGSDEESNGSINSIKEMILV